MRTITQEIREAILAIHRRDPEWFGVCNCGYRTRANGAYAAAGIIRQHFDTAAGPEPHIVYVVHEPTNRVFTTDDILR